MKFMVQTLASYVNLEKMRWYRIDAGVDLLGDTVVVRRWGSKLTGHGSFSHQVVQADAIENEIEKESKRRQARGYFRESPVQC